MKAFEGAWGKRGNEGERGGERGKDPVRGSSGRPWRLLKGFLHQADTCLLQTKSRDFEGAWVSGNVS